ncbi:hypothetical protein CHLRE_15g637761v5 [Chlamydomonas reinhardtii]|uniref:ABC transporter domain-containing protein n=1 Tax=Chlamydomonas reinhardtii TaxID=3055 RepID=A0A2K3CWL5_CHLRE|nr:uncharacterized protein CHLRE_15g637761v5 [Chlamydomonas reinhardtii]PNW72668.1 hypothetical protein CHLRE_15g637761v5 [Chlamydomonas reinhardtii]
MAPQGGIAAMFSALPPARKRLIAIAVIAGGLTAGAQVKKLVRSAQREQRALCAEVEASRGGGSSRRTSTVRIAVDKRFLRRLLVILSICVPSWWSKEAGLILAQGGLLVSRTLLTDWISRIEGYSGSTLVSQQFDKFWRSLGMFALIGIPAAVVNSGLKYMQKQIELAFQERLTSFLHAQYCSFLHAQYCSNRAYYAASTLGGLTHADQRITEDVEKFAASISELYAHTFKPLLDVVLFTRSLARTMGYRGQFMLYAYYVCVAYLLRAISPPLAAMTAQEAALSGAFRAAHQRLVTCSEEVAFNDPPAGAAEQLVLNQHLRRLLRYTGLSAAQRGIQQVADGYFVKYFASVTALVVYGLPIYFQDPSRRGSQGELTRDYIRSMRLLQNTSRGVGDLILVYKRVTALASHTSRVSELLEQVARLVGEDAEHRELFRKNVSVNHFLGLSEPYHAPGEAAPATEPPPPPQRLLGATLCFHRVALDSPDGTPLIRELSFEVLPGKSVLLMGPNGCGKSSLFRVLAGLWPLQAGEITTPEKGKVFYLSQRPYLVTGTLRDQILYPNPPRSVWRGATAAEHDHFAACSGGRVPPAPSAELDSLLGGCLRAVELEYLLTRHGWEAVHNWNEVLSGGEKQRLAMARLLYHRPQYAVLDECTSAVSADGELRLYGECLRSGVTFLSIAHRPALKRFHSAVIHFDANVSQTGLGWWSEALEEPGPGSAASAPAALPPLQPGGGSGAGAGAGAGAGNGGSGSGVPTPTHAARRGGAATGGQ